MNSIKRITGITLLIFVLAIPAFAWGPGFGMGFGPGPYYDYDNNFSRLTEEEQDKLDDLYSAFEDKTKDARNEIIKKQIDLNAVIEDKEPDLKKAKAIQKEINDLQAIISDAHLEFIIEAKKINPDIGIGKGARMDRGTRGGRGMGRGR
ncbi:MAG: periplasmic heavy metal sensor [Deltaproteobacteria bacterium]|nr:periplasmic heavy metal sensor [Deltaproteobacteria bacterium]